MSTTLVREGSKSEQAYAWVRSRIISRAFVPGYRLVLGAIAGELDMSVVPVREAIRRLEAEGLVTFERNIGAHVALVDESEYEGLAIDLPVVVRFGYTELPIRTLTRIGPGSVIDLGRSPDDPVEILVSNRIVARGEVVIVGGNYGVRILEVASQSDRARSMEA